MASSSRGHENDLWAECQNRFSEFAGFSAQAFDDQGNAFLPSPALPSLCAFLERFPETSVACRKDCFRKATTCRASRKILSARCYAGLSYRIVPIRKRNQPHAVLLVGRVLTEVLGEEQCLGLIERYKLPRQSFLKSLADVHSLGSPDLDKAAAFARRLASSAVAVDTRLENRHSLLERRRNLLEFARQAATPGDRDPGRTRGLLEYLGRMLPASGLALLIAREDGRGVDMHASIGLGEDVLHALARPDWPWLFDVHGRGAQLHLATRQQLAKAGLEALGGSVTVQRLPSGQQTIGYLVVAGADLAPRGCELLESASSFVASRLEQDQLRARAELKDEESRLLGQMAERCLTARSVEELLPLALEAAMHGLHARRGSILLAEAQGRIVGRALRGDHAPISATIDTLSPDSISHRVFFARRSLLVRDTDQEPGLRKERQFPYASRSFVSVPLRENGHALGVLHLTEREGEEAFTPRDLSLLERLSLQASGAIRKARLEEEVQALRVASTTDHLTGVYNRRYLEERLVTEFQRARRFRQPLAVAMLDLDDFKTLNDQMGHAYGDEVLKEIAGTIRRQLRSVDMLARYGGDEFVLLLPGTNAAGAVNTAEKIRGRIESTAVPGSQPSDRQRTFTVSVGLSVYPDMVSTADDLLQRADQALFLAKRSGRNSTQLWKS